MHDIFSRNLTKSPIVDDNNISQANEFLRAHLISLFGPSNSGHATVSRCRQFAMMMFNVLYL